MTRMEQITEMAQRQTTECIIWPGPRNANGYGRIAVGVWVPMAHRVAYEIAHGPIPEGLQIDHLCRTRACVNTAHLEAVTPAENVRRMFAARRLERAS